ncbi:Redoxin-domain-containing protein [Phlebopus sp. FC_14]|nr:Redoxin-domain-containing protein [Phlebopus sp. FC_14]
MIAIRHYLSRRASPSQLPRLHTPYLHRRKFAMPHTAPVTVSVGDKIPTGKFAYVPYTPELDDHSACGVPTTLSTDDWAGKKVVLVSVPGAFTPTCHVNHLPPYLKKYDEFKAKGVDVIAVVAANDPFVMSGWSRVEGLKDKILALSDVNAEWSAGLGLSLDLSHRGFGTRTARYAIILDDLIVKYIQVEPVGTEVTVSGADVVLAAL